MALKTGVVSFRVSISGGSSEGLKRFAETYPVFPLHLNIIFKKKIRSKNHLLFFSSIFNIILNF